MTEPQAKVLAALAEFGIEALPNKDDKVGGKVFVEVTDATIAKISELKGTVFYVASDAGVSRGG